MDVFIERNREDMYSALVDKLNSRISLSHRPLAYQRALYLISGLWFIHEHDIIFSDFDLGHC